ncbi:MAG: choice-of-anchor B family protein [Saprospiraceae bacterium]|nr:choice-of-anchor B family protein [Saprospiraceae bacterium]
MIKQFYGVLILSLLACSTFAQNYNLTQLSNLPYTMDLNDVWGYQHSSGVEYALVGTVTGTSIVSLEDPTNPVEKLFIPGNQSLWRDLKTWGDYAYVTTDVGTDGLLIINLSDTSNFTYQFINPQLTVNGVTGTFNKAHNLYIDENGYCYIAGSNISVGETLIFDVHTTPGTPIYMGTTQPFYAHDAYTRGDTLWTSDINDGFFSVYDVSDKTAPVLLAQQTTSFVFTHNAWISDDGNTLFTTDEKPNAFIGSYDVSDLTDIKEIDLWRPFETEGQGVIPHNVHVWNDYIIISYYTDGVIVLDASHPDNLVEVAKYDTYPFPNPTTGGPLFFGAWGAYPFSPSGMIFVTDINTGLHVFQPTYQRACRLEGLVTELGTGTPLSNVDIQLDTTPIYTDSDLIGEYKTGIAQAGTYNVTYSKAGYFPKTVQVTLQNGVVTVQDVELEPAMAFAFSGQVIENATGNAGIENATVHLISSQYEYTVFTDANGNYTVDSLYPGDYTITTGKWGYHTEDTLIVGINVGQPLPVIDLEEGYRDEFALDLGWTTNGNASSGDWERVDPEGVASNNGQTAPEDDLLGDIGELCYVTGNNGGGQNGADDIDDGLVRLISPTFDMSNYDNPHLSFYYWFVNEGGTGGSAFNDTLTVDISNGIETVRLTTIGPDSSTYAWSTRREFKLDDYLTLTNAMQVTFIASDNSPGHIVEAAIDLFEIVDSASTDTTTSVVLNTNDAINLNAYPNPFENNVQLAYDFSEAWSVENKHQIQVRNLLGQLVETVNIQEANGILSLGENWEAGIYLVTYQHKTIRLIKR